MSDLVSKHAAVIGIDAYTHGLASLRTAAADARAVADALEKNHGYADPIVLVDTRATGEGIVRLLEETLPARVAPESGLVLYFAGHGVAMDGDDGPQGYLIPQDAHSCKPETWLPMGRLRQALSQLPCRHLLVVLDCCFAGSFRWVSTRKSILPAFRTLYDSQYARFLEGRAWQVLTSASHQEEARDVVPGRCNTRERQGGEEHSPFAAALLAGLAGASDSSRGGHEADGVITATELYQYVFEELVPAGQVRRQTPGLWPLRPDNTGEFIFLSPRREKKTRPDPPLDDANNPWLGLESYGEGDASLFFGRERVVKDLLDLLSHDSPLLAVVGASGTGKSSVVKAGVLPRLRNELSKGGAPWTVASAARLEGDPRRQLAAAERLLAEAPAVLSPPIPPEGAGHHRLLFIDQFEELYTQCQESAAREGFLARLRDLAAGGVRVLLTLRSDFEPRLKASEALGDLLARGRYLVPALTSEEFRQVIEEPATAKALFFEPKELVGELVDEVMAMPGALPLLSFALAEMYRQARLRRRTSGAPDRALTRQDYEATGGVVGALHRRASELLDVADAKGTRDTVRRVALRMVALAGGRVARRRISRRELDWADEEEQERVDRVVRRLTEARLVVADEGYVEPAHDTLVLAWDQLLDWLAEYGPQELQRQVWRASEEWDETKREKGPKEARGLLWTEDPRLAQVKKSDELNQLEKEFVDTSVWQKRKRQNVFAGLTAVVIALLVVAAVFSAWKRRQAEAALDKARNRELAVLAHSYQPDQLDLALLLALELERRGEVFESRRLLFAGLESSPRLERLLHGHQAEVRAVAWSAGGYLASAGADSTILLWDAAGEPAAPPLAGHEGGAWSLAWSADGHHLAAGGNDGVLLWEVAALDAEPRRLGEAAGSYAVAFSPDGRTLAVAQDDDSVRLWNVESAEAGPALTGATDWLTSVAWSPEGRSVAAAGMDKAVRIWDAATGRAKGPPLRGHSEGVMSLAWSGDGRLLASGSLDGTVALWDPVRGEPLDRLLEGLIGPVGSVAWSGDSETLAVGGIEGGLVLWDVVTKRPRARPATGQLAALRGVAWSAGGQTLASGNGSTVVLWNTGAGARLGHRVELGASEVRSTAVSLDGAVLAAEGRDPVSRELTLRLWDAASGESLGMPITRLRRRPAALAWSGDGRSLSAVGSDRTVRRFETTTRDLLGETRLDGEGSGRFASLAWSSDGTRLAAGSRDGTVSLWDGLTGETLGSFEAGRTSRLAWSADGTTLASGGRAGAVRLWDAATGQPRGTPLSAHDAAVASLAWSGDGRRLASGSRDRTIRIWDVATGRQDGPPASGHAAAVTALVWSADGRKLASAGNDRRILLWDAERRVPLAGPFEGHRDTISGLFFSPDGKALLSISTDGTLVRWDVDPDSWRRRACRIASRNLTSEEWRRFLPGQTYRRTCPSLGGEQVPIRPRSPEP